MASVDVATGRVLCHCLGITEGEIRAALDEGRVECLRSVMRMTGAGTGCTACHLAIRAVIARAQVAAAREAEGVCEAGAATVRDPAERSLIGLRSAGRAWTDQCEGSGSSPTWVTR